MKDHTLKILYLLCFEEVYHYDDHLIVEFKSGIEIDVRL